MRGRKTRHVSSRRAGDFIYLWWEEVLLSLPLWEEPFFQNWLWFFWHLKDIARHGQTQHKCENTKHRHTYFLLMSKKFEECIDLRFAKTQALFKNKRKPNIPLAGAFFPFWELQQNFLFWHNFLRASGTLEI